VDRHEFADPTRGRRACVGGGLHRADIAANHHRDVAGADVLFSDQRDVRRLDHRVGRFDRSDKPFGFHETERFSCHREVAGSIIPFAISQFTYAY